MSPHKVDISCWTSSPKHAFSGRANALLVGVNRDTRLTNGKKYVDYVVVARPEDDLNDEVSPCGRLDGVGRTP